MSYDKLFCCYRIDLTIKQKYDIIIVDDREATYGGRESNNDT